MRTLVIFDFDGTLVNTITDVALCFNEALRQCGYPTHPLERFDRFVGGDLETVVSRMLPPEERRESAIDAVKTIYRQLYLQSEKPNTKPYPGVMELLREMKARGYKLAVNSNKGQVLLDDMVNKMFPTAFFDAVVGYQEGKPSKPEPYGVDEICRLCGCTRADAVYVGDGDSDVATAVRAEIPCVFVTWGQGANKKRTEPNVLACVDSAEELKRVLFS